MGTRNFGLTGVNEPISLVNIRNEFAGPSGPSSFSSYYSGGGNVPRHERNFFIANTGSLTMSSFTRNDIDAAAPSAERHYTARIQAGAGTPSVPYDDGIGAIGWDYTNFGTLFPGDLDPASPDLIGLSPAIYDYVSMQGMSWVNHPYDPFFPEISGFTEFIFFVYGDYRRSTLGYHFFDDIKLYSWDGTTAILEKILERNNGGFLHGSFPGVTYWTWVDFFDTPFVSIASGNQFILRITTNVST